MRKSNIRANIRIYESVFPVSEDFSEIDGPLSSNPAVVQFDVRFDYDRDMVWHRLQAFRCILVSGFRQYCGIGRDSGKSIHSTHY